MHYYPHHIGDYQRDTAHLSLTEHGAYRLLIDNYYVTQKCLPTDAESLHRICRAMSKAERAAVDFVAAQFFTPTDNGLRHKRIEEEIADYQRQAQTSRENGKRGGRPPSGKPKENPLGSDQVTQTITQTLTQTKGNQEPVTIDRERAGASPTLDEVKAYAPTVLATEECAENFWNSAEAVLWVNKHGQPIAEWKPLFRNFAVNWKANEHRTKHHANHRHTAPRSDTANAPGRYA